MENDETQKSKSTKAKEMKSAASGMEQEDSSSIPPTTPASTPPPPPPAATYPPTRRNWFPIALLVTGLLLILIVGYMIVNSILKIQQEVTGATGAVGTQVQQVLNPTPTLIADPVTVIREIRSLARLETVSYTIEKVITAESGEGAFGFLFRDRLLLVAQGEVIAGVDLSRMDEGDIKVAGTSVFVTVPASEIFVATLDNDETYVYDRQTAVLGQQVDLETLARQEAEAVILQAALDDGILVTAQKNAELYLTGLFKMLGFEEVVFVTATPGPDQDRGK